VREEEMQEMEKHREKLQEKPDSPSAGTAEHCCPLEGQEGQSDSGKRTLWTLLKLGACCAAPILALAILVPFLRGGDTGLAAIGGNLLYFAALLACPLGMYFMMRHMGRMQRREKEEGHEKSDETKALPLDREKP
jgi:hypothetical protein